MKTYVTVTQTAKLVRRTLKEAFPGVKFSVRCRDGGSSININWTDGPTAQAVRDSIFHLEGGHFDGMTDSMNHVSHEVEGVQISYGANFIFENRGYSKARLLGAVERVWERYGLTQEQPRVQEYGTGGFGDCEAIFDPEFMVAGEWITTWIHQDLQGREFGGPYPGKASPITLAQIKAVQGGPR